MNKAIQHTIIVAVGMAAIVLIGIMLFMLFSAIHSQPCAQGFHLEGEHCEADYPLTNSTIVLSIGQSSPENTFKLTAVFADHVTGLQCYDYPIPTCFEQQQGSPVSMTIGQQVSNGCTVIVKLVAIDYASQQATFEQTVDTNPNRACPICWWQLEVMDETTATAFKG